MAQVLFILQGILLSFSVASPLDNVAATAKLLDLVPQVIPALNLTSRLAVNYNQPAGGYLYCGTPESFPATAYSLNDTGLTITTPWQARSYRNVTGTTYDYFLYEPDVRWTAEENTLYTLMMVDPIFVLNTTTFGPYVQHWMVVNIPGSNISAGETINAFLGPGPVDPEYHKYVFVVYPQSEELNLTQAEITAIKKRAGFNVSTFLKAHAFGEASAINWMFAEGDTWGYVEQDALGFSKLDCFAPVSDAAKKNGIVPEIVPELNLSTHLTVHYTQPAGSYSNCGQLYNNPAADYLLNDTGVTDTTPWNSRSYRPEGKGPEDYFMYAPKVTWQSAPDTLYTLLMVDPVFIIPGSQGGPYIDHWMVININGSDVSSGEIVNPLLGPAPVDPPNEHKYTFILYAQSEHLNLSFAEREAIMARRGFNLTEFVDAHDLGAAVGINWMYAMGDTWSPVVQDALGIRPLDCFPNITAIATMLGLIPRVVPSVALKTRLSVSYTQPAGNYSYCGLFSSFPAAQYALNDTGLTTTTPWQSRSFRNVTNNASDFFRYAPEVKWDAVSDTLYTLLMVDPLFVLNSTQPFGPYLDHWMVININGSNLATGTVINPLLGPGPGPADLEFHKYVFLLYTQAEEVELSPSETAAIKQRAGFNLTTFLAAHNYTYAVGMNWMFAMGDEWGAVEQDALNFTKLDCLGPVAEAAEKNGIVPTVVPAINLTTKLTVTFNQPNDTYSNCGTPYANPATSFSLNDVGVTPHTPWDLRSYRPTPAGAPDDFYKYEPEVNWVAAPNTLYTLMMVDPVFVVGDVHGWGPYVQHWMVINIEGNNVSTGEQVNPFLGPGPDEPNEYHKYTLVLYAQPGRLNLTADERANITSRVGFSLPEFVAEHDLSAASGINWVYSMVDPWALVQLDELGFVPLNCFAQVEDTAKLIGIVPRILPKLDLTTQLRVAFDQPAASYVYCGTEVKQNATKFTLADNDLTKIYYFPWDLRSFNETQGKNRTQQMTQYAPNISWIPDTDVDLYTLMVVDPIFIYNATSSDGPFINHMLVFNIKKNDTKTGTYINNYFGPAPSDPLYHKYLFLLYRQKGELDVTGDEVAQIMKRVGFNLTKFVTVHQLGSPVGLNWAFSEADMWSAVARDYAGIAPIKCQNSPACPPTPTTNYVHLTPGAFTAICILAALVILILLGILCVKQRQRKSDGAAYQPLLAEGATGATATGRKSSVNRR